MLARLKELQLKMSERDQKILIVLVIALAMLATYWAIFRWFTPEYTSLQESKSVVESDIAQLQRTIGTGKVVEEKMLEKRSSIEESMKRFDWKVTKGEPLLVLGNQSHIKDSQFQLLSLNQGQQVALDTIWEVPYTVTAKGSAESVQDYVMYLDEQDKALKPSYLRIDYYDSFAANRSDEVFLELQMYAYGAQDAQELKERLIVLEGRANMFSPTVKITAEAIDSPAQPSSQPMNQPSNPPSVQDEADETEQDNFGKLPRYNFPSKQELKR